MGRSPLEWLRLDPLDRSLIVTHLANEALRCPGCGAYTDESTRVDHVYRIHEKRCNECNARHKYTARKEPRPGTLLHAEAVPIDQLT